MFRVLGKLLARSHVGHVVIRALAHFIRELARGNPYAIGVVAVVAVATVLGVLVRFAARPLGGDAEAATLDLDDEKNPYRLDPDAGPAA